MMLAQFFLGGRQAIREFVVNVVTKSGGINYGQSNTDTVFLQFYGSLSHELKG